MEKKEVYFQRKVLDDMNEYINYLKDYDKDILDYEDLADRIAVKHKSMVLNSLGVSAWSCIATVLAEELVGVDIPLKPQLLIILTAAFAGTRALNSGVNKEIYKELDDSDCERLVIIYEEYFDILEKFLKSVIEYIGFLNYDAKEFVLQDKVKDMFLKNGSYIDRKKEFNSYGTDFEYKNISDVINNFYDYDNGLEELIIDSLGDLKKQEMDSFHIKIRYR